MNFYLRRTTSAIAKSFMQKFFFLLITSVIFLISTKLVLAQDKVNAYFFYGQGCPHCAKEEQFLDQLEKENGSVVIHRYEVWHNFNNSLLLSKIGKELNLDVSGVPVLLVGDKNFVGYLDYETTGAKIKAAIGDYIQYGCDDRVALIISGKEAPSKLTQPEQCADSGNKMPELIKLPLIGSVNTKNLSLPLLTMVIGLADGFNPCSMWTLLFLLSLLLGMVDRKRMWILGSTFIIASAAAYFLYMTAWLNLFLFVGYIMIIRLLIGFVALGSGGYHLYDYYKNRKGGCHVMENEKRKEVFAKLKKLVEQEKFWLAMGGIALLACAVNLVELVCSAGFPAVYTQVLAISHLSKLHYYLYILFYIFFYELEAIVVFLIAMFTMKMKVMSSKYTRWTGLVGGALMVIIGVLLLFRPEWLMF